MVRPKKGMKPMIRVKKEILSSECFDEIRRQRGEHQFMQFAESKIMPIEGDLLKDGLNISREDYVKITENVDIIINSAASVRFDDPLKEALAINFFGPAKLLDLAKKCKKIKVFCHISTAYVNCDQVGAFIEEKYTRDREKMLNRKLMR